MRVIGMMSGTSLDGIDAAVVETDGEAVTGFGAREAYAYTPDERTLLTKATEAGRDPGVQTAWHGGAARTEGALAIIAEAERLLTRAHASLVSTLAERDKQAGAGLDLIGFHGQTLFHAPDRHFTWQIGDGALLAQLTGLPVICDFRSADVAAGGEGAPLVPLYHKALLSQRPQSLPAAVLNLGGVGNLTYFDGETLLAFDTGPANGPLDEWMAAHTGEPLDRDGRLSALGTVNEGVLLTLMDHPYFDAPPPKSLDRQDFDGQGARGLSLEDGAATLVAFAAAAVVEGLKHFPAPVKEIIVCGGGRHNPTMMAELARRLRCPVRPAEAVGWRGDFVEAEAFAYLAARSKRGLSLTEPGTTGVQAPLTGGTFILPAA